MVTRLLCTRCGDSIHPDTARDNDGLCIPCTRGNTLSIEERREKQRQERAEREAWDKSPERIYWSALYPKVGTDPKKLATLSEGDRLYFLLSIFDGEVRNGGFDQFFYNSSGNFYEAVEDALRTVGATQSLAHLHAAKKVLFGDMPVPLDRGQRFDAMSTRSEVEDTAELDQALEALEAVDGAYYELPDEIASALERIAVEHKLY